MKISAPAKINLHLRIGPTRADGFHPLLSWFCTISLADELTFAKSATPGIQLTCSDPSIPSDERNLVYRAAKLLLPESAGVQIHLKKNVPHGAGLGGGSSDAAHTLLAINRLFELNRSDLHTVAAQLGSDVPFFLQGPSAVCSGRGEIIRSIDRPAVRYALLILPRIVMPTPAVYRQFDGMKLGRLEDIEDRIDWHDWTKLSARQLLNVLVNDLEVPAFAISPELSHLRALIESIVAQPVRMSGSGSSLFTLYDQADEAHHQLRQLQPILRLPVNVVELAPSGFPA